MNRNRRNIIIAVILLAALLIIPFWPNLRQAISPEEIPVSQATVRAETEAEQVPDT